MTTVVQRLLNDDLIQEELDEWRLKTTKAEEAEALQDTTYTQVVVRMPNIIAINTYVTTSCPTKRTPLNALQQITGTYIQMKCNKINTGPG